MNENDIEKHLQELEEISKSFEIAMKELEKEQEDFWNSLSKEDQVKAFCAVVRRIHRGDIKERRSYRGVLYDVFDFGRESYVQAQEAGYLTIHNALFDWVEWQNEERNDKIQSTKTGVQDSD